MRAADEPVRLDGTAVRQSPVRTYPGWCYHALRQGALRGEEAANRCGAANQVGAGASRWPRCKPVGTTGECWMVSVVNRKSAATRTGPLYLWVASAVRDSIEAGELSPNASIPSERALSDKYGVSRMTARHAVETLALEGYVIRDARRGTFVAEPRLRFSVGSFTRIMAEGEHVPGCEVLTAITLEPSPTVAEVLELPGRGGLIHRVQRLRTAEGEPIAIEEIHVSAQRFPGSPGVRSDRLIVGDSADALRNISNEGQDARVVAVTLDRFEGEALKTEAGRPGALALTRTVHDADGGVLEVSRDVYRGDRAEFFVTAPVDVLFPAPRLLRR